MVCFKAIAYQLKTDRPQFKHSFVVKPKLSHDNLVGTRISLEEGKMQEALEFFCLNPNNKDASLLIAESWRRGQNIKYAFDVIHALENLGDSAQSIDLAVVRSLVNACLKAEQPEYNRDVLGLMERHSVFPDETCFGMLLLRWRGLKIWTSFER